MDTSENEILLYRPVGLQELALIYDGGMKAFPTHLPQQPIFYPVLQLDYARQIASGWNAESGGSAGYVMQFKVEDRYIGKFETHTVGESQYQELWIPAEELEEFNKHIVGHIKVLEAHFGDEFEGFVPEKFSLQGKNAVEQFTLLTNSYLYKRMDFYLEIKRNHKAIFLNYPFWLAYEFKNPELKKKILQAIKDGWLTSFPQIPLPLPPPPGAGTPPDDKTKAPARPQPLAKPVRQEPSPVKRADPNPFVPPVEEETVPTEEDDSLSEDNFDDGDGFEDEEDFDEEDTLPEEERKSASFEDREEEDVAAEERDDLDALEDLAREDSAHQEENDAQAHLRHPANSVPESTRAPLQKASHVTRGVELGLSGQVRETVEELTKAVTERPQDVIAQVSLGVAFHRLGEDDRALACHEKALQLDPIYAEAHYFRANILYSRGNARDAISGYTMAIGLKPELIDAHEKQAPRDRLTDYSGVPAEMVWIAKPARRILELNKALESDPRRADLFRERAAEYYRLWNYAQAIADYTSFLALQPDDADALHLRGVAYEQVGQNERARQDYQRAIAINPQLANSFINRGVSFGNMGNYRQAIASLTDAIRLAPENADSYFNRGTAYLQLGDFDRAIEDFSEVLRLSPVDEEAHYWRGMANEQAGRRGEAIADYRQFLALSQDETSREAISQKLRQWQEEDRDVLSSQPVALQDLPKSDQVLGEPRRALDLYDLVLALGERALDSTWFGRDVDCSGEKANELYAFTDQDQPIDGRDFLAIASGIRQTRKGDFQAFDPGAESPWIFIRAWQASGFYLETDDPGIKQLLKSHFPTLEEVEGATPTYAGMFLRI